MNDFSSKDEYIAFAVLGPLPRSIPRLSQTDKFVFDATFTDLGFEPCDYKKTSRRLNKTFSPRARAPGGGDVMYVPNGK